MEAGWEECGLTHSHCLLEVNYGGDGKQTKVCNSLSAMASTEIGMKIELMGVEKWSLKDTADTAGRFLQMQLDISLLFERKFNIRLEIKTKERPSRLSYFTKIISYFE